MKKLLLIIFVFCTVPSLARHIAGGEIFYEWVSAGPTNGTSVYKITLRLFRDCQSTGASLDGVANIAIFDRTTNSPVTGSPFSVNLDHIETIQKSGIFYS